MGKQHGLLAALMAGVGVMAMYRAHLRPWMYAWGATDYELTASIGASVVSVRWCGASPPTPTHPRVAQRSGRGGGAVGHALLDAPHFVTE